MATGPFIMAHVREILIITDDSPATYVNVPSEVWRERT